MLNVFFSGQYTEKEISLQSFNWRMRGLGILMEVKETGTFVWKVYSKKTTPSLPLYLETLMEGFLSELSCGKRHRSECESIIRRFFAYLSAEYSVCDPCNITQKQVRGFVVFISKSRPKSMDKVIEALRGIFRYFNENGIYTKQFWVLLSAPRSRDHRVKDCLYATEICELISQTDRTNTCGKRDFAVLSLAAVTGLRAGDIASLRMADIDWKKDEIHLIQGKTGNPLHLPISRPVMTALADYILHGRPETSDNHVFIRHSAPYNGFHDGVSVSCIFRKYLKKANIKHVTGDGKTLHGIRRGLGTGMVSEGIPVTTVAQVLGHRGTKATKQYISTNLNGLRHCLLDMSLDEGDAHE
jgi:site-specific recombinase XerD